MTGGVAMTGGPARRVITRALVCGAILSAVVTLAACGGSSGTSADDVVFVDSWTRPTPPTATAAAFYGVLRNQTDTPDTLVQLSSDSCDRVEFHRSILDDDVMRMRPADASDYVVDAKAEVVLEPGGLHLMCVGIIESLVDGSVISVDLGFEQAGPFQAEIAVENR